MCANWPPSFVEARLFGFLEVEMPDDRLLDMNEESRKVAAQSVDTFLVGRVVAFDADNYTVDVDVEIETEYLDDDEDAGQTSYEGYARLNDLPVTALRAGGYSLTFPIEKGDTGRVMTPSKSLHEWLETGKRAQPMDPDEFPVDSSVFIPDLVYDGIRADEYSADSAVLAGDLVRLGSASASLSLVRTDLLVTSLNDLITAINLMKPYVAALATAAGDPNAALIAALLGPATPGSLESTQVKVAK